MKDKKFQYVLCPGRFPEKKHLALYNQIYQCWHDVWSETFAELDNNPDIKSDNFTRQDVIGALLVDGECKAMSLFQYTDANSPTFKRDSYFSNWSEIHQAKLCAPGKKVIVCSHFTIHPTARKESVGLSMKDLLVGISMEFFNHTDADVMTGAMRKNRKVHTTTYDWGSIPIASDIPSGHGDALVDLIMIIKNHMPQDHELVPLIKKLWDERLVIHTEPIEHIEDFEAKNGNKKNNVLPLKKTS